MNPSDLAEHAVLECGDLTRPTESQSTPLRASLVSIGSDGALRVRFPNGVECLCDCLETALASQQALAEGDRLLVLPASADGPAIVLGRIGKYREARTVERLTLDATESLTLKCGDASIDLRADGKVMIRGEDVLVRAKGTKRIRAGTVSIN